MGDKLFLVAGPPSSTYQRLISKAEKPNNNFQSKFVILREQQSPIAVYLYSSMTYRYPVAQYSYQIYLYGISGLLYSRSHSGPPAILHIILRFYIILITTPVVSASKNYYI
jgi:hypothetical protein